ncbi:MAG: hypothetical protein AVDCRST_MAG90-1726 [uncultured Microvirga sp.]|uniref:Uncharacterized protein n=1 Tax=uncultured Microvirga sp. TaxID=412392 RepID=A0A6J4LNS3_9HYPH|nr:MAG: hypothetical protein AVDCRST_MAG90-1726 [uncultured Microvirga sp.]
MHEHLQFIAGLLTANPGSADDPKLLELQRIVERRSLRPVVTCFRHGSAGAKIPAVPLAFRRIVKRIHGEIETDFDVDDRKASGGRFAAA